MLYGIVGAGGCGRDIMPVARAALTMAHGFCSLAGLVFVVEGEPGEVNGHRLISADEFLAYQGERHFVVAISDWQVRKRITEKLESAGCKPFTIISPGNCLLYDGVTVGDGSMLSPFVVVASNATLGRHVHLNIYSYVGHDCRIGDFVTFGPAAGCNGNVVIEEGAYVGAHAVIRQSMPGRPLVIGRGAVVGMGAVVTKSVPPGVTVIGNPARPM